MVSFFSLTECRIKIEKRDAHKVFFNNKFVNSELKCMVQNMGKNEEYFMGIV